MNRLFSAKPLAAALVAFGALAAASAAHARSDVFLSIGVPMPVYVQPAPVYSYPQTVYSYPQPVYTQPQPIYTPAPVYYGRGYEERRYEYVNERDWGRRHHGYHAHRFGPNGDMDRDGVPNRYDRAPDNPYRR